ncbi:N-acetyltransferase Ats1 [Treponema primitia ZAS-2]|uniref:N-acetyltransferase Ats1 n=1 Tax=Treponema primitia (strain ATCC BAA-887 / DSM 12427 / ZAS-2) TaxID=545694 RepID=F5YMI0_TREPZ|nr:GNAT family N-acetyltransferase [Treponema primitia]AEF84665.1 N-acetyltransferase Ats1 [Treponema primitia ZAS-2]
MDYLYKSDHTLLRYAEEKDTALILEFIRGLAEYEHLLDRVEATAENLKTYIFQEHKAEAIIAEYDGVPAGFALYFCNFSTFRGRPGIYIEDLFVKPELRGKGLGKALLSCLAFLVKEKNYARLEWACLNWNKPSIAFYKAQGGQPLTEWTTFRVTGDELTELASRIGKL